MFDTLFNYLGIIRNCLIMETFEAIADEITEPYLIHYLIKLHDYFRL